MQVRALHDAPFCINNQQVMQSAIKLHPRYSKKYPTTIGIEDARIPAGLNPNHGKDWDKFNKMENHLYSMNKKVKAEEGAFEISSPIITTPRQAIRFYEKNNKFYDKFAEKYPKYPKLVPNTEKNGVYLEGGGGHIHISLPNIEKEKLDQFVTDIFVCMLNRPHFSWFMNEWCDDDTLVSTFYNAINHYLKQKENAKIESYCPFLIAPFFSNYYTGWGIGPIQLRTKESDMHKECHKSTEKVFNTIEFRLFGAFWDAQHMIDCIELACAIWEYCLTPFNKILYIRNVSDIVKFAKEKDIVEEFNIDLVQLGLDPERYERYHKNYFERLKWGRLYSRTFRGED